MRQLFRTMALSAASLAALWTPAQANGLLVSSNGFAQLGVADTGNLDATTANGFVGIGYKFTGQGGRTGFQDALTPGCPCESWGVSANGVGGQVGDDTGNQNINLISSTNLGGTSNVLPTFASVTGLNGVAGLTVTQTYSLGAQTATGALFEDSVVIHNGTGALLTDVRYARAMDWDVPPTEFHEVVTIAGTKTTSTLLHSTDNGFANANPLTATSDTGLVGPVDSDGTTGPSDHGSLFVFGFGDLADGADYKFNIFYGAGANGADAKDLLSLVSPELYSIGYSNNGSGLRGLDAANLDDPAFVFAFNGVGGSVIVPPSGVPLPASAPLFGGALVLVGAVGFGVKRSKAKAA